MTGGVGPTHDDVTFEGVARGMGRELQTNKEVSEYLRKLGFDEGAIEESRMNKLPKDAEVRKIVSSDVKFRAKSATAKYFNT